MNILKGMSPDNRCTKTCALSKMAELACLLLISQLKKLVWDEKAELLKSKKTIRILRFFIASFVQHIFVYQITHDKVPMKLKHNGMKMLCMIFFQ